MSAVKQWTAEDQILAKRAARRRRVRRHLASAAFTLVVVAALVLAVWFDAVVLP